MLAYILWNGAPEIFSFGGGDIAIRWYGVLFALGFVFGQMLINYIWKTEGKPAKDVEAVTIYALVGTVVGARLGHCLFYQPDYYLVHPLEILKIWEGGLASHGATIGILLAIWFYSRKRPAQSFFWVMDRVVITVALAGCLIRMGNLMNSEIIGKPYNGPTAFVFGHSLPSILLKSFEGKITDVKIQKAKLLPSHDTSVYKHINAYITLSGTKIDEAKAISILPGLMATELNRYPDFKENYQFDNNHLAYFETLPDGNRVMVYPIIGISRHPSQLYEALSCLLLYGFLLLIYFKYRSNTPEGLLLFIFVTVCFGLRFMYEYFKENQVAFENDLPLNMGQLLSIPLIIIGVAGTVWALRRNYVNPIK